MLVARHMTARTPCFDTDEIELLFSEAEERPATSATAALPGAFAAHLPRGVEVANVDREVANTDRELAMTEADVAFASIDDKDGLARGRDDVGSRSAMGPAPRGTDSGVPASRRDPSTRELPIMFSPNHTVMASAENLRLAVAFDHLELELARLGRRWEPSAPRGRIDGIVGELASFMRILLDDVELEPIYSRSAETSMFVHDTYVRLITVAGVLREAMEGRWANAADLESAYAHAEATLDAFVPFVGLADRAMRRICLESETLENALRWLSRQLDEEAAERLRAAEAYVPRRLTSFRDN
jgi:hypothetical protein